jgi:elongation factor P|tara:strand:+ start:992 stop:1555 length:564 start_codon:yes stop_codon:yes gene_type:complete
MPTTSDIKNGVVLLQDGKRMKVLEFLHVKPGKGNAFVRTKLRDLQSGKIIEKRFNAGAKIELIRIEAKEMQYLYKDGDNHVFMDNQTYDQVNILDDVIGDKINYLKAGQNVDILFDDQIIIDIRLPAHVHLEVVSTEPGEKGNTATGATKPAKLETNYSVNVPLFIDTGDILKIDTRSGEYIERSKS